MKKRSYLYLLLFMGCCIGWFVLANIKENQAPVPGWSQFGNNQDTGPLFRFWLPKYYEGVNPQFVTWMIQGAADDFRGEYSSLLDEVKIVFAATDTRTDDAQPDVFVSYSALADGPNNPELALEEIYSRIDKQSNVRLIESELQSANGYEVVYLVYDTVFEGLVVRQVQYIIFDGDFKWSVIYMPNKDKYEEDLNIFEQSIRTFEAKH